MGRSRYGGRIKQAAFLAVSLLLGAAGVTQAHSAATVAVFKPEQGELPYPNDLYFAGSTDGTLNIQSAQGLTPIETAVNALDGFSTTAPIRATFGGPLNPASFSPRSVTVFQVRIDNVTKRPTQVVRQLTFGLDYTVASGPEAQGGDAILEIRPTHPLVPSVGTVNNGYVVVLTNALTDASGHPVVADTDYADIKAALPGCSSIKGTALRADCLAIAAQLQIARCAGIRVADVVLSFSFSTGSISDTLVEIRNRVTPAPLNLHNTGLTTAQADPQLAGHANIYVGTLSIPYYLSRKAPLTGFWQGNPSPLDPSSRLLTRFNPVPVPTETLEIPVLVTVPNAASATGAKKPAGGWPAVIFQHGITRNRTDMLAVADSFADSGFVVVAIDLPLHGITDPTSPLYATAANPLYAGLSLPATGSIERTFDLDLVNNTTGAPGPDGQIDPSGTSFINLTSVLTSRDNLRESAADLFTLARSLSQMNLDANAGGDINPQAIHLLGHSLGAIISGVFAGVAHTSDVDTMTLAMPGGGLPYLLRDSASIGPTFVAGIEALGPQPGTTAFEEFLRDLQNVVDAGDPLNYIAAAAANHPIHMIQVVGSASSPPDQVVPNSATQRLIQAAALTRIPAPAVPGPVTDPNGFRAYVDFVAGEHGSIIDPTSNPAVTTQMQIEAITFTGAPLPPIPQASFPGFPATRPGTTLLILNPSVVQM